MTYPSDVKSLVKIKNGNNEGRSTVAQTVIASKQTPMYVVGDEIMAIKMTIMAMDRNFFIKLFDKVVVVIVLYV